MMKQYIMFLLGLLILSACTNDEYLAQRTEVEEGIPTRGEIICDDSYER